MDFPDAILYFFAGCLLFLLLLLTISTAGLIMELLIHLF